jgi:hypothetical protein
MKQYLFALAAIVVAVVLSFVVGVQYQRWSQPDLSAELRRLRGVMDKTSDAPRPSAPVLIRSDSGLTREELREEIRAALQSMRDADAAAAVDDPAQATDESGEEERAERKLTPEKELVRGQATALIDTALGRGKWNAEDRAALRRMADEINDTQAQLELFQRVSAAINDGSLKPELDGPLL